MIYVCRVYLRVYLSGSDQVLKFVLRAGPLPHPPSPKGVGFIEGSHLAALRGLICRPQGGRKVLAPAAPQKCSRCTFGLAALSA